jgi:hypothetical protein
MSVLHNVLLKLERFISIFTVLLLSQVPRSFDLCMFTFNSIICNTFFGKNRNKRGNHGVGASLYVALQHVAKGQSKIPFMIDTTRWLQGLGFEIKFCVIDREYYRQGILDSLKLLGVDVIVPTKEWKRLRNAKEDYLNGVKGRTQRYCLTQGDKKGRRSKTTRCWIILHPRGKQRIDELKRDYLQKSKTLDKASQQIYALVTTRSPLYSGSRFPLQTKWTYKMRWQIETSFRDNERHKAIWGSKYDGTRFIGEFGRCLLFNA